MKFSGVLSFKVPLIVLLVQAAVLACILSTDAFAGKIAAKRDKYDIIYILTKDLEKVLDYKDELETVFDPRVINKLKIVERGDEYALLYDGNDSARTVTHTLVAHAELLNEAGFDEPYATKEQNFHSLYNVSYGMGPNLEPLKKRYEQVYGCLGGDVKNDLFIEKTDFGNYSLVYRHRGDKISTTMIARKHARILKSKKIQVSLTTENNNMVVFGESSLIDDVGPDKPIVCQLPRAEGKAPVPSRVKRTLEPEKFEAPPKIVRTPPKPEITVSSTSESATIESSIEQYLNNIRRSGRLAGDETTGWMVYDLERDRILIDINANEEFQAASMIKPFVALAYFHQVSTGRLTYTTEARRKMEAMIQHSNNSATNWLMRQAGGPATCDAILKQNYAGIFQKTAIKEYIPAGGRTYLNSAPPSDYVRFLRALWNKKLPSEKEIRRLMALPGRDRIYYGTPLPKGTLVYNKTGTTARLCGDMGILVTKTKQGGLFPYIIVGIIERQSKASDYSQWMHSRSRVIREVSTLVYEQLKKEHQLL